MTLVHDEACEPLCARLDELPVTCMTSLPDRSYQHTAAGGTMYSREHGSPICSYKRVKGRSRTVEKRKARYRRYVRAKHVPILPRESDLQNHSALVLVLHRESHIGQESPRTTKSTAPTTPQTNQPRTAHEQLLALEPVNLPSDKPHSNKHSIPENTHDSTHMRSTPQAAHYRQRPRQSANGSAAPGLHKPT